MLRSVVFSFPPHEDAVLRLQAATPVDTLWDHFLPAEVKLLPVELAAIDTLLSDPTLLTPFQTRWQVIHSGALPREGRPTIPMATYLRIMVIKNKYGWGYETLLREISDSLHLRRFCLIPIVDAVPHESTVRKLTRRLGPAVVQDLIRGLFAKAIRERRFRPRALRADSTVAESDIRFPTDSGLCADGVRLLAKRARKLVRLMRKQGELTVRDRSRSVGRYLRELTRSLRKRTGEAKAAVQRLTEKASALLEKTIREAKRVVSAAQATAAHVRRVSRRKALTVLENTVVLAEKVVAQVAERFQGKKIENRIVSFADPEARPVRRGKLARPNEFGYVVQMAEVTQHTQKGARGLLLPPKLRAGSTGENALLSDTVTELKSLGIVLRESAFDAGFHPEQTRSDLKDVGADAYIVGSTNAGSRRTRRRLACYRVGNEGRISHLKREYGAGRSRLRGTAGAEIWECWVAFTYNVDSLARNRFKVERPKKKKRAQRSA